MKIYADPITINCRKVIAGLQLMGAPYELAYVDYFKGEQKAEPYASLNPMLSIPAMDDSGFVLWESNAILQYAADKINSQATYPTDAKTRADINRWLFWESSSWFPSCYTYLVENCIKPLLGGATDTAVLQTNQIQFDKLATILDARLAKHRWVAGTSGASIADIALAAPMHLHGWQQIPFHRYTNIKRWLLEDIESLDCWKNTWIGEGFTTQKAA